MTLLLFYLFFALGFSFFCSVAEAVLLSITTAYISALRLKGRRVAGLLEDLKRDIDAPLAAILSLNTIAHTVGAAGVGAQAAAVFGSRYLGVASAILTLLILVFSEIIPKTIGTVFWRKLAPGIGYSLKYLVKILYPFVWLSRLITGQIAARSRRKGFSREEFAAMAHLGREEGELAEHEASILKNVLMLKDARVEDVMTPSPVIFCLPESITVEVFFSKYSNQRFSRIPVYGESPDQITGFVLRNDLLLAKARGNTQKSLVDYRREIFFIPDKFSLLAAFDIFLEHGAHIMCVFSEYGAIKGLISLEDIIETLMGLEIVDESDTDTDLQELAKRRWRKRAREMGVEFDS